MVRGDRYQTFISPTPARHQTKLIAKADRGLVYSVYITGNKGEIAVKISPGASWQPTGNRMQALT
jgi:hypothetical protein